MNFDELKERISSEIKQAWGQFQESSFYNQMRDRYDNMTPAMQKLSIAGTSFVISLIILSIPYTSYNQSQENVNEFEDKRSLIRELLKVSREASEVPNIPQPPPIESLKTTADSQLKNANLLPEQIKSVEVASVPSKLIPQNMSAGALIINLAKLNLRQVIDIGYQLQAISSSVKMQDLTMTANREDLRYFDVSYHLIALAVPTVNTSAPEPEEPKAKSGRSKTKKTKDEE